MDGAYNTIDLGRLGLTAGDGRRLDTEARPGDLALGGERYAVSPASIPARVDVSRTATGYALRLRLTAHVSGPCMRCLDHADVAVEVDVREVDQPGTRDTELESPYVEGDELSLGSWAHDALALALPGQLVCRADCQGLCPVCGTRLNEVDPAEHRHEEGGDPRWQKLRELNLE